MDIELSNLIINLYNKKNNKISFNYKTDLLITTDCTFGNSFIDSINVSIILPDKTKIEFDKIFVIEGMKYPFSGEVMAWSIECEKVIKKIELFSSIIKIIINCNFNFSGWIDKNEIIKFGILRRINNKIK